jgi:hypothetical protein
MVDRDLLFKIAGDFFVLQVSKELGDKGAEALRAAMETAKRLYEYVDPASVSSGIIIIAPLAESVLPAPMASRNVISFENLGGRDIDSLVVQVLSSLGWAISEDKLPDPIPLSRSAVVYQFLAGREAFYANEKEFRVPSREYGEQSWFAVTAFDDLQSALDHYDSKMARRSSCPILCKIWHDAGRRYLRRRPELRMRRSLTHFLKCHLRGSVEVRPEQVMDESRPVDVKVTWFNCNRLGVIEIKWLGQSKKYNGALGTAYSETRAIEGARQLADYLDANRVQAPTHITHGYLVIFDARRRGNVTTDAAVSRDDLFYYEKADIKFSPKYHEERSDFECPRRIFLEPVHL